MAKRFESADQITCTSLQYGTSISLVRSRANLSPFVLKIDDHNPSLQRYSHCWSGDWIDFVFAASFSCTGAAMPLPISAIRQIKESGTSLPGAMRVIKNVWSILPGRNANDEKITDDGAPPPLPKGED